MTNAQKSAANPEQSVWVAASAGTGKTKVLTDRVLRLLLGGVKPGKILCLTFTKAAAAEMSNRINKELGKWVVASDGELNKQIYDLTSKNPDKDTIILARNLFLEVLDTPDGIKIQTIHSFCQSLMSRFPLEANIAPHFKVVEERTSLEILNEAKMRLLIEPEKHSFEVKEALNYIAKMISDSSFSDLLKDLMNDRQKIEKLFNKYTVDYLIERTHKVLGVSLEQNEENILENAFSADNFNAKKMREIAQTLGGCKGARMIDNAQKIAAFLEQFPNLNKEAYQNYKSIFLKTGGEIKTDAYLASGEAVKKIPDILDYMQHEANRILQIEDKIKSIKIAKNSSSLLHLAEAILVLYQSKKASSAFLDYGDLISKTEELLSHPDIGLWILYKLDSGIDHILVDEAQDTSPQQWRIISCLCEEFFASRNEDDKQRTIFVVGDEKQSIYSFQGADPKVFNEMSQMFAKKTHSANMNWQNVNLDMSFRSTDPVLNLVDNVFANSELLKSIVTNSSGALKHNAFRNKHAGRVELWPIIDEGEEQKIEAWQLPLKRVDVNNPQKQLADKIANTIKSWIIGGRILQSKGRAITAGDVIVLVRNRSEFVGHLINSLKNNKINVAGADRMKINDHIAVMDLVALGQFILLPEDDLNLACLLKSPLIGLDDGDLYKIAKSRKGTLLEALKNKAQDSEKFKLAYDYVSYLLNKTAFRSPFEIYSNALNAKDGRKKFIERLGEEVNDPIDEFLSLTFEYERLHPKSLQGFISWLNSGETEVKRDMDQSADEVRIMTVHGSKGLQAPIVFMPDTTSAPDGKKDNKILWAEYEDEYVMLWPAGADNLNGLCKDIKEQNKKRAYDEYLRLLYVAITRAEDEIYICGYNKDAKKVKDESWYSLISSAFVNMNPTQGEQGEFFVQSQQQQDVKQQEEAKITNVKFELPDFAINFAPDEPMPPKPLTPSKNEEDEPVVFSPALEKYAMRGKIIHKLLQYLPDIEAEKRISAAKNFVGNYYTHIGKKDGDEIIKTITNVLDNAEVELLFNNNSKAEVPITGMINNYVVSGQIDRLVQTEDEILIVDYKTNRNPPKSANKVSPVYIKQMAAYRNILKQIYETQKISCVIIWTQGPKIMPISDEAMDLIRF